MRPINRVAVLGAGVMGSGISALLANAGMQVLLLDVVPAEPNEAERKAGLTARDPAVRNRLAAAGLEGIRKGKAGLFVPSLAANVTVGNFDDDLPRIRDCDWVIEVVVENLAVKRKLFAERVAPNLGASTVLSSNTSGLSVKDLASALPADVRRRFLVTHFFNPPRMMRLVEVVPCAETDPAIVEGMSRLLSRRLGKGVVRAKDTPNFIANRIGVFSMCNGFRHMEELGLTVEEVDAVSGPATARPGTALYRLADLVGLDTMVHVADNSYDLLPDDEDRESFRVPDLLRQLVARGFLGNKTRQGFYKRQRGPGGDATLVWDPATGDHVPQRKPRLASVAATKGLEDPGARLRAVLASSEPAAEFAWRNLRDTLLYSAKRVPEIADDVVAVDDAMRWGFSWELGPFEMLDAIGVPAFVARAERDGVAIPRQLRGVSRFYAEEGGRRRALDPATKTFRDLPEPPGRIDLVRVRRAGGVVEENAGASLLSLGDGVLCLEFHTKMNAIGNEVLEMIERGVRRTEEEGVGLVVANEGRVFSAGANLAWIASAIQDRAFERIDRLIADFQRAMMAVKYARVPVVAAPHGMALGGGCELCLHATSIVAFAEIAMGLVELGVGLLPAGGGTKEMALRAIRLADEYRTDPAPFVARNFELIATARVSGSADELREMGLLRRGDAVSLDPDSRIHDAKLRVLALAASFRPSSPARDLRAPGRGVAAALSSQLYNLRAGGFVSPYDEKLGRTVASVITGGDVPAGMIVPEEHFLALEREAFLSLCGEPNTLARIQHMLETGKPLRN